MPFEITAYADKVIARRIDTEPKGGGRRGKIGYFSRGSRRRMLGMIAEIRDNFEGALFVTLTYPSEYPTDPRIFKRHLDNFLKRIARYFEDTRGIWRLEFQRRGAPHYHLLLWGINENLTWIRRYIAKVWYEVVHSGDGKHARAGTNVQRIESRKHAGRYVSKYAAKEQDTPMIPATGEVIAPGRYWGYWGQLDRHMGMRVTLADNEAIELRRILKHLLKSRGKGRRGKAARYAQRLVRQSPAVGWHVFGCGDMSCDQWGTITDSTIWQAVMQVIISTGGGNDDTL